MTTSKTETDPLTLEHTFDATKEELYNAWVDPEIYKHWMNPAGIDLVIREWDAREGGKVAFDMPQPDGSPHAQTGMFHVLDPYDRVPHRSRIHRRKRPDDHAGTDHRRAA